MVIKTTSRETIGMPGGTGGRMLCPIIMLTNGYHLTPSLLDTICPELVIQNPLNSEVYHKISMPLE